MALTARQLNRATLARQLLLAREPIGVVDAMRRIVAVQAQEPASPYVALWNRIAGFDPADLDAAYADHRIIKATLIRITLHAVAAEDYPAFRHAMESSLRASRLNDRRFTDTGMTAADADALVADVLTFLAEPRRNSDVEAWLGERLGDAMPRAWWALRTYAPVVHAPTGGPWSHGPRPAYRATPATPASGEPAPSVQHLVRRYLEGFGPATAQDVAQFTILRKPAVAPALEAMADTLEVLDGPGRARLYDVPDAPRPDEDTPAPPRLMAMWDSSLLAYADRSRIVAEEHRRVVIRTNGDVLPTVLVDGYVAGVWRATDQGIEVAAFRRLPRATWDELATEAAALVSFLTGRDPLVYRRYGRWWDSLPAVQTRVLGR